MPHALCGLDPKGDHRQTCRVCNRPIARSYVTRHTCIDRRFKKPRFALRDILSGDDGDDADALRIKLQEKKEPLEDDACSPEKSAQKRKGISSADEKEEAQARESKRRVIGGASNGSLGKHGKQKTTEGSDATALETTVQGQVTERGNTMDAAKAKVSSAAESQELQESSQKDAAKEASKEQLITDK
ncbi:TPA: hypothetical protein ACH3X2_012872 [Trebouxia sp. C0005]